MFVFCEVYTHVLFTAVFQKPPSFYQRMFEALGLLVDFFYANGKGLEMDDILVDEFQVSVGRACLMACIYRL